MGSILNEAEHEQMDEAWQITLRLIGKYRNRKDAIRVVEGVLVGLLIHFDQGDFEETLQELTNNLRSFYAAEHGWPADTVQ